MTRDEAVIHGADHAFVQAVIRAGRSFIAARGGDPEIAGAALAAMLRSDMPLGPGEREELAQLVTGEWLRLAGGAGQSKPHAGRADVKAIVADLRARVEAGEKKEAAKLSVAVAHKKSRATVENFERMVIKCETAIQAAIEGITKASD